LQLYRHASTVLGQTEQASDIQNKRHGTIAKDGGAGDAFNTSKVSL